MAEPFPYQGLHFAMVRQLPEGPAVELWMPPAGIWGRISPPDIHADMQAAIDHAARYASTAQVPMIAALHVIEVRK